jgi:hypothetical protein
MSDPITLQETLTLQDRAKQELADDLQQAVERACHKWRERWGQDILPLFELGVTRQQAYGGASNRLQVRVSNIQLQATAQPKLII